MLLEKRESVKDNGGREKRRDMSFNFLFFFFCFTLKLGELKAKTNLGYKIPCNHLKLAQNIQILLTGVKMTHPQILNHHFTNAIIS